MTAATESAVEVMLNVADWLEETMPEGEVNLYGVAGDYTMLVGALRTAVGELTAQDND